MKKYILILTVIFCVCTNTYASQYTETIGKMEDTLFGFQYNTETDENRLSRIENEIYGASSSGNVASRMSKLKKDLSVDLLGQEIPPTEDTFEYEEMASDPNIQYPAVDELEQSIFKQSYPKKDIRQRLSALEEKTFGKSFSDDLSTRVDRLKAEIRPKSFMNNAIAQSENDYYDGEILEFERNYHLDRYDSPNRFDYDDYNSYNASSYNQHKPVKKANITTVEKSVLNHSYKNDSMNNRLSRLENAMFGTEFSGEDEQTRINRISSAYRAQKSASKYDSNKFSQNVATAVQIGTLILMVLACIL